MDWVNPATGIGNTGLHEPWWRSAKLHGDLTARRGEFDRISDEVPQNLFQFVAVAVNGWKRLGRRDGEGDLFPRGDHLEIVSRARRDLADADFL